MANQSVVKAASSGLESFSTPGELLKFLERGKAQVGLALPKHLNPDRMLRLALTEFSKSPKLRDCTGISILSSIIVASQLGLEIGVAGQGYLIPYKNTCTFVPGWQGLVGLLNNTGRATAWTGAVFEGDVWNFSLGSAPRCEHVPGDNFGDPEHLKYVYACGKVNGSEQPVVEAWPIARVKRHRDRYNRVGQQHYSFRDEHNFEMYARKVVLLQVLKYMPRSVELNNAIVAADAAEMGRATVVDNGVVIEQEPGDIPVVDQPKASTVVPSHDPAGGEEPPTSMDYAAAVKKLIRDSDGVTLEKVIAHLRATGKMGKNQTTLEELAQSKLRDLFNDWAAVQEAIGG